MAERILYGHVSGASGTGYRIRARSMSPQRVEDFRVNEFVQKLRLRPEELLGRTGWYWMDLDSIHRIFGVVRVLESDVGVQTLEYRFAVLNYDDCDKLSWQPFQLRDQMLNDDHWLCVDEYGLPELQVVQTRSHEERESGGSSMFSISWKIAGNHASENLEAHLDSVAPEVRKSMTFLAPDVRLRSNPRITLLSLNYKKSEVNASPQRSIRYGKAVAIAAGLFLCSGLVLANLWTYRNLQEARGLAQDRDQAYRKLERDSQEKIDEQKVSAAIAGEDARSRLSFDYLNKLKELLNAIYREASSDQAMERDINGIRHYLETQAGSSDYNAALLAALDKWIAIEKLRNTQRDSRVEQQRIANEMKKTLNELRGLIAGVNSIRSRFTQNQTENRPADSEVYAKIEEIMNRLQNVIDTFEAKSELR